MKYIIIIVEIVPFAHTNTSFNYQIFSPHIWISLPTSLVDISNLNNLKIVETLPHKTIKLKTDK